MKAFLLRMQPFQTPRTMSAEFLSLLNQLCNRDKHRQLLVVPLRIKDPTLVFRRPDGTELFREFVEGVNEDGANVFTRPVSALRFERAEPEVKL